MLLKRAFFLTSVLIVGGCIYVIASAILITQTTGTLYVSSSDPHATLIVSQANSQAKVVGVGKASVRLKPGSYQISASDNGRQAIATVQVYKKHITNSSLSLAGSSLLPSENSVSFVGIDSLLDYGMSSSQLSSLKLVFVQYSHSAKKITVSNISPAPHDPKSASTMSVINFKVSIDSGSYNAVLNYDNLSVVLRLYLYNPQNNSLLFDSGAAANGAAGG